MPIEFLCPYGHRLKAPEHRAGKQGRCPKCSQLVIVPVQSVVPSGRGKLERDADPADFIELSDSATATVALQTASPPPPLAAGEPSRAEQETTTQPSVVKLAANSPLAAARIDIASPAPSPPDIPAVEEAANFQVADRPPPSLHAPAPERVPPPRWVAWARDEWSAAAYRAAPQQVETTYWLAVVLIFVIVFAAAPALAYMQLDEAPAWAQLMLLIAGAQLAYAAWLIILPDWSTVRFGMWVFGISAALYAAGMGLFTTASPNSLPLGLTATTASASGWCGAIVLVLGLLSYACGQLSSNWRRADLAALRRTG